MMGLAVKAGIDYSSRGVWEQSGVDLIVFHR